MSELSMIRIGARGSRLSLLQVEIVSGLLRAASPGLDVEIVVISTAGDRVLDTPLPLLGGKGVFTQEIETALLDGRIDLAVHSLKDLPTSEPDGIVIGAIPPRASARDLVVSRHGSGLGALPHGARVGTSSPRRAAQLRRYRADLEPVSIRGNVETRLRKSDDPANDYDAIVLAEAGLERLDLLERSTEVLTTELMLPAPGQGALAVQGRPEPRLLEFLSAIGDPATAQAVAAERAFLEGLGGGCSAPIAAYGEFVDGMLQLAGRVLSIDGSQWIDISSRQACGDVHAARSIGLALAETAIAEGADVLLKVAT